MSRDGPYPHDRTGVMGCIQALNDKLNEIKARNITNYLICAKEVDDLIHREFLKTIKQSVETSILSQTTNQLLENYNDSILQASRFAPSSQYPASRANSVINSSMQSVKSRLPFTVGQNRLFRIQETILEDQGVQNSTLASKNGLESINSAIHKQGFQEQGTSRQPPRSKLIRFPPNFEPIKRGENGNNEIEEMGRMNPFPANLQPRVCLSQLNLNETSNWRGTSSRNVAETVNYVEKGNGEDVKVKVTLTTSASSGAKEIDGDLFGSLSDCDSVGPELPEAPRQKTELKKRNPKKPLPEKGSHRILKNWTVTLKGGNIVLQGMLYEGQRLRDRHHCSNAVQIRKPNGALLTCDGTYELVGGPHWRSEDDPPQSVRKLFKNAFPCRWRQAVKLWMTENRREKNSKKSKDRLKEADAKNSVPGEQEKDQGAISDSKRKKNNKKEKCSEKNKKTEGKASQNKGKNKELEKVANVQNQGNYDVFDELNLDVPKIGISAMTPNTFFKVISSNPVEIGAHTPTLKTFASDDSSRMGSSPITRQSKPKKDDVIAMRMAKAIESGKEPSSKGKSGNKQRIDGCSKKNSTDDSEREKKAKLLQLIENRSDLSELSIESDSTPSESSI